MCGCVCERERASEPVLIFTRERRAGQSHAHACVMSRGWRAKDDYLASGPLARPQMDGPLRWTVCVCVCKLIIKVSQGFSGSKRPLVKLLAIIITLMMNSLVDSDDLTSAYTCA